MNILLADFQKISKGEGTPTTTEIINNIKAELVEYVVVSEDGNYKVMLYKDADGKETLGLNKL